MKLPRLKFIRPKFTQLLTVLILVLASFAAAWPVFAADMETWTYWFLALVTEPIIWIEGWLITQLAGILLSIIAYNGFVNAYAVTVGWTLVRDIANLFFVMVVLAIAIGTILHIESYNFKKLLPKVLLMAVLVNFSRAICGLIIDFAQVIMMTFAAGFASIAAAGKLMSTLHITDIINTADKQLKSGETVDNFAVFVSALLAIVLLGIAVVVLVVMLGVVIMRMIMIWLLVVLSPFAYIFAAFPQGQRYAQQWWQEFSKYVIVGPVLAFFLWLSFSIASQGFTGKTLGDESVSPEKIKAAMEQGREGQSDQAVDIFTNIGSPDNFLAFLLGIGMLMGGLMITSQLGVAGGAFAGQMSNTIRQKGLSAVTAPFRAGRWAGRGAAGLAAVPFRGGANAAGRFAYRKVLETPYLRAFTPAYWAGASEKSKKLLERQKRAAGGAGAGFMEKLVEERILRRKGSAMERGEEAERSVINEYKSEMQKELGDSAMSKEKFGDLALRAFKSGGKEGERRRQAILEMAAVNGNLDDVYSYMARDIAPELGMTQEEAQKFSPERFRKFVKGFLWKGDQAAADKFDPEAIVAQMAQNKAAKGDTTLQSAYDKFQKGEELSQEEAEELKTSRGEAQKQATKAAENVSEEDRNRLLSMVNLSSLVIKTGHWEQDMGTIDPKTGAARFMDTQEQIEDVSGEAQKMGMRNFLNSFAPHNIRSRTWDEESQSYKVSYRAEDMEAYQRALWGPNGPFKPQQAGEMRQMQTRIMEQFIGGFFDQDGKVLGEDFDSKDPEKQKKFAADMNNIRQRFNIKGGSDEDAMQVFTDEFKTFREANPKIFDALWQTKYMGGRPASTTGTSYAKAWVGQGEKKELEDAGGVGPSASGQILARFGYGQIQKPKVEGAPPEPTAAKPKVAEETADSHWKNLVPAEQENRYQKTRKEIEDAGELDAYGPQGPEREEAIRTEAKKRHYSETFSEQRNQVQAEMDEAYKALSAQQTMEQAPVDFAQNAEALASAITQGLDSKGIIEALGGLETILNNMNQALDKLPAGAVKDAAIKDFDKTAGEFSSVRSQAQGGTLDPGGATALLHKINENLKAISAKTHESKEKEEKGKAEEKPKK